MDELPKRTGDTMVDAIALSSPSGRMSKRARKAAEKRLDLALFGPNGMPWPVSPKTPPAEKLRNHARLLRELAARGMNAKKYLREAARDEEEARKLEEMEA